MQLTADAVTFLHKAKKQEPKQEKPATPENETIKTQLEANNKELKATKEMNFTLARKIDTAPEEDAETTIFNFMKGLRNGY